MSQTSSASRSESHVLQRAAKRVTLAVDGAMPSRSGIVILAYHRVGQRTPSPVDLPVEQFRAQMQYLATDRDVLRLDDALALILRSDEPEPPEPDDNPVVLTFDDGTADFADVVLPILVEYSLPATIYVATSHLDSRKRFPAGGEPISWAALRDCVSTGLVAVGAHTHTHTLLDRCDRTTVDLELDLCNERIADELGFWPLHFAYPKAIGGSTYADAAVRSRYRSAAIAGTRPNPRSSADPWRLRRSPVQAADEWEGFLRKSHGGMRTEDDIRRVVNTIRYLGKTS